MNACTGYDFRYSADEYTPEDIRKHLEGIAKKYVFQKEMGDGGYIHYQGRLSLIKRRRRMEALKLFKVKPNWFQPTITEEYEKWAVNGDAFYILKEDTRVDGPWTDMDEKIVTTRQLEIFKNFEMYPYQKSLYEMSKQFDMRTIDFLFDPHGNIGKSIFSEFMESTGLAEEVPPYRLMDDIFQWVCTRPVKKCYIIDMPRGMKKDKLGDFYSGIEVIKNGVAYDKRYHARKIRFDRPRIFVFSNTLPEISLMSKDRWKFHMVNNNKLLVGFDPEKLGNLGIN